MQLDTPIDAADLVWALAGLAGAQRLPFDAQAVLQRFPPPLNLASLVQAAAELGLQVNRRSASARELARLPQPLLALRRDGMRARLGLVLCADAQAVLVVERDRAPRDVALQDFQASYQAEVLLVGAPESGAEREPGLVDRAFGLAWFVPELLRHKAVWREVLAASLALQLVGLAVPLCAQVVIDKVVVHHSQSTLAVVMAALAIFVVFSAALAYARQYLLLHTGNRVDAVLGMRAFEHLLRLPPRYFETRPTGSLVARLQGIETIREFITGAAASVLLDVPFLVVFLAVMLWYSVTRHMI